MNIEIEFFGSTCSLTFGTLHFDMIGSGLDAGTLNFVFFVMIGVNSQCERYLA